MLYEVLIAVTIFALAVVGMVKLLNMVVTTSNEFAYDAAIRRGLESILAEARQRELAEMAIEVNDENLGVTYRTTVEALALNTQNGQTLTDLYTLTATATYQVGAQQQEQTAQVWIHSPAGGSNSTNAQP